MCSAELRRARYEVTSTKEINSAIRGHNLHKIVWTPIIGEQLYLEEVWHLGIQLY